jgi:hypothetical protein
MLTIEKRIPGIIREIIIKINKETVKIKNPS